MDVSLYPILVVSIIANIVFIWSSLSYKSMWKDACNREEHFKDCFRIYQDEINPRNQETINKLNKTIDLKDELIEELRKQKDIYKNNYELTNNLHFRQGE